MTIGEVAAILHTAPSTIRSWEQRLGFPTPMRSPSGHRLFDDGEIELLRDALQRGLGISSAIREIQAETGSYEVLLREALGALDSDTCDPLLEAAIAFRGLSRAFDEAVLASVEAIAVAGDPGVVALAVRWASDRACWARRCAGVGHEHAVVVLDGSTEGSATRAASEILQLQLSLRATRTYTLVGPAIGEERAIARRIEASAIVFVGTPPPSAYRRNAFVVNRIAGFRTNGELLPASVETLPVQPRLAADQLLARVADDL